jgi:hypothetical protein
MGGAHGVVAFSSQPGLRVFRKVGLALPLNHETFTQITYARAVLADAEPL